MEHMVCKTVDDLRDKYAACAVTQNAYTSDDSVVFYLTGHASQLPRFAKDFVQRITGGIEAITEEQFLMERATVLQECGDVFADPTQVVMLNMVRKYFGMYSAIGLRDDVQNFTFADFKRVYAERFSVPDMVLYVGPEKIDLSGIKTRKYVYSPAMVPVFDTKRKVTLEPVPETDSVNVTYFSKKVIETEDALAIELIMRMLSDGLQSPLYQEIRAKRGLSYFSIGEMWRFGRSGIAMFMAATYKEKADPVTNGKSDGKKELCKVYRDVFKNLDKYLTHERFDICKSKMVNRNAIDKCLQYQKADKLVGKAFGYAGDISGLSKLTYEKTCEVAHKYLDN